MRRVVGRELAVPADNRAINQSDRADDVRLQTRSCQNPALRLISRRVRMDSHRSRLPSLINFTSS